MIFIEAINEGSSSMRTLQWKQAKRDKREGPTAAKPEEVNAAEH
jgi:hypothetical protein